KDLKFTRDVIGLMMSIYIIMSGLPGPLVARLVNKLGSRTTIVIGTVMLVAGAVAMATIVDSAAGAIAGGVGAKFLELLIKHTGDWRDAWWVIAAFSALAGVLALLFVREKP